MKGGITMSVISIHPIEYLRKHSDHEYITDKFFGLVILIIATLCLGGGLYNTLAQLNTFKLGMAEHIYMNPFPYEMPDVMFSPMSGFPL
jgi:hypothetical protein